MMAKKIVLMVMIFVVSFNFQLLSQDWELQAEGLASRWQAIDAVDSNIARSSGMDETQQ